MKIRDMVTAIAGLKDDQILAINAAYHEAGKQLNEISNSIESIDNEVQASLWLNHFDKLCEKVNPNVPKLNILQFMQAVQCSPIKLEENDGTISLGNTDNTRGGDDMALTSLCIARELIKDVNITPEVLSSFIKNASQLKFFPNSYSQNLGTTLCFFAEVLKEELVTNDQSKNNQSRTPPIIGKIEEHQVKSNKLYTDEYTYEACCLNQIRNSHEHVLNAKENLETLIVETDKKLAELPSSKASVHKIEFDINNYTHIKDKTMIKLVEKWNFYNQMQINMANKKIPVTDRLNQFIEDVNELKSLQPGKITKLALWKDLTTPDTKFLSKISCTITEHESFRSALKGLGMKFNDVKPPKKSRGGGTVLP